MVSILAVPAQTNIASDRVELRPDHVRQWLAKLPLLDSEASLADIFDALYEFNRAPVKPAARLVLLELYRTPIKFITEAVERTLSGNYVPFPEKHARLAELCRLTAVEMAYGYKAVVVDLARGKRHARTGDDLCTALHRSIRYLATVVYQCAISYSSYPAGTWSEIHSLYSYARKLGLLTSPVRDALNQPKPDNSIAHAYNQALLFGLSDGYRNPIGTTGKIFRYLDRWASAAEVLPYAPPPTTRCQFIVDPEQDRPAWPYSEKVQLKKTKRLLLLDTRGITKTAHNQWRKLRSGSNPKSAGLGEDFYTDNGFDMLERAVLAWGIAPRRKYPRNSVSGMYQLVVGIDPTHHFLNGGRNFKCSSEERVGADQRATVGTFGVEQMKTREVDYTVQSWRGSDESIHGLCVCIDTAKTSKARVRVGELVGFRPDRGDARWSPAVVRWARITDQELRIGLQKLGSGAKVVAVKPIKPRVDNENLFQNSILLPELEGVRQEQSLVTPPGIYGPQRNLMVDDGTTLTMARAGKPLERRTGYDWFGFEVLNI